MVGIENVVVGDWIKFNYTDKVGVTKEHSGEVREEHRWGFRMMTADGWRSFNWRKMPKLVELVN